MTANPIVVNTNEFFCMPVGKSRQAAIFLGNLVKNAIEEGKRIPKRMEMSSDLGMCVKWIEDIGVPAIYAYSAYYSAKGRGMMTGEGQSMRVALEFISKVFGQLSADECMLGWREFCSKGKKIVAALNQLCGEASLLAKNPELLNVTKYCIEGADMLRSKLHSTRTPRLGRYTKSSSMTNQLGHRHQEGGGAPRSSKRLQSLRDTIGELRGTEIETGGKYSR